MQLKHQAINLESEFYKTKKLLHDKIKDSKSMDCEQLCNLSTSLADMEIALGRFLSNLEIGLRNKLINES